METPNCLKCGSASNMAEQDSGLTYKSWRCLKCDTSRSQKNWFGHVLPFLSLGLIVFGLPGGDSSPPDVS